MNQPETILDEAQPPEDTEPQIAAYILRLPDRHLGNWDSRHMRAVTGRDWHYWEELLKNDPDMLDMLRCLPTRLVLRESNRYVPIEVAAEGSED